MTYTDSRMSGTGITTLPGRAADWLDSRGRCAWIAAMVLGFVVFWPLGLALVIYITATNRWSKDMFKFNRCAQRPSTSRGLRMAPSGNSAFDAYRDETIRRLEDEQEAFNAFLKRLREAKDKQEFDAFMNERAKAATSEADPKDLSDY
ncbi:MAG: DUF2852 domain-containing protein [Pseudorhodobacter sp.]